MRDPQVWLPEVTLRVAVLEAEAEKVSETEVLGDGTEAVSVWEKVMVRSGEWEAEAEAESVAEGVLVGVRVGGVPVGVGLGLAERVEVEVPVRVAVVKDTVGLRVPQDAEKVVVGRGVTDAEGEWEAVWVAEEQEPVCVREVVLDGLGLVLEVRVKEGL